MAELHPQPPATRTHKGKPTTAQEWRTRPTSKFCLRWVLTYDHQSGRSQLRLVEGDGRMPNTFRVHADMTRPCTGFKDAQQWAQGVMLNHALPQPSTIRQDERAARRKAYTRKGSM